MKGKDTWIETLYDDVTWGNIFTSFLYTYASGAAFDWWRQETLSYWSVSYRCPYANCCTDPEKNNFWSRRSYRTRYLLLNPEQSGKVLGQFKSTTMAQTTGWFPPCGDETFYYMTADIQEKRFQMHSKCSYCRCMGPVSRGCFFQGWSNRRGQKTVAVLQSIATCSATKMTLPNTGQTKKS